MAYRKSESDGSDDESVSETITSDFLSVSGNTTTTFRSGYLSVAGDSRSTTRSDRTLSLVSQLSDRGFDSLNSENTLTDIDNEKCSYFASSFCTGMQLQSENTKSDVGKNLCSICFNDGDEVEATHLCKSCKRPEGRYICHRCLQSHNKWFNDHFIVSLSVSGQRGNDLRDDTKTDTLSGEDSERKEQFLSTSDEGQGMERCDKTGLSSQHSTDQTNLRHLDYPKEKMFQEDFANDKRSDPNKMPRPRFYKDDILTDVTKKMMYNTPLHRLGLTKYGKYSARAETDVKRPIVTAICELENGEVVLVDSDNSTLKILNGDKYGAVSIYKVKGNPDLICSVEMLKVAVAYAQCSIDIIDLSNDIKIKSSFPIKQSCSGLTSGNESVYVCFSDRIEVFNELGVKKDCFQLILKDTATKYVDLNKIVLSKDGDILYATDRLNGILIVDLFGNVLQIISEGLEKPDAICTDGLGNLYVTEINSDRVLKIALYDGQVEQVLREVSEKEHPMSLCHQKYNNRLLVGVWCSDYIHVFTC